MNEMNMKKERKVGSFFFRLFLFYFYLNFSNDRERQEDLNKWDKYSKDKLATVLCYVFIILFSLICSVLMYRMFRI